MSYVIFFLFIAAAMGYSIYAFRERYRCRKKNEELRDRYKLLKESIEEEPDKNRARYRIAHEQEKTDAIKKRLKEKYGDRLITERKLLEEILEAEKEKAEALGVTFTVEVLSGAEDLLLCFSQDEMISFFLNLLDNAIEAAAGSAEKKVSLSVGSSILLTNSKHKDSMPQEKTSKDDAVKHGFGLGILEKYGEEKGFSIEYVDQGEKLTTEIKMRK